MPQAVIMAGGQGERFWPLTHTFFPKYRIKFDGKHSLLQKTYKRLLGFYSGQDIWVVTTREHAQMIREELPQLKKNNIIIEPFRRNTAAAILMACTQVKSKIKKDEVVSFFPADHLIQDENLFKKTMKKAVTLAKKEKQLVAIGFKPSFPATGYGYILRGKKIAGVLSAFHVKRFVEKPNRSKALRYIKAGNYLWNGGIFTWKISTLLEAFHQFSPEYLEHFNFKNIVQSYEKLPKLSIDHALLEKADNIVVVETRMDWCDMGSWDMFKEKSAYDKEKNVVYGNCLLKESHNTLALNYNHKPIVTLGVKGLLIVQTEQGTLISKLGRSEEAARLNDSLTKSV